MQSVLNRISVEECRKLIPNESEYSDEQVVYIRNKLYGLANILIKKFKEIKNFILRVRTIEAKAKIVHN